MFKTIVYLTIINTLLLTNSPKAQDTEIPETLQPTLSTSLSPRLTVKNQPSDRPLPRLLTDAWDNYFSDDDDSSDDTAPLTYSCPSPTAWTSSLMPGFSVVQPTEPPVTKERIMTKNWQLLEQQKPLSLRALTLLKISAHRHVSPQECADYTQWIKEEIEEMY